MGGASDCAVPRSGYLLCADARSGSTFLGAMIRSTNLLGRPWEAFFTPTSAAWMRRDPRAALESILATMTTPNGIYGIKIFSPHFDMLPATPWPGLLPDLKFVHLERRDLLRQAISLVRAQQTGSYKSNIGERSPPRYDPKRISSTLTRLASSAGRWRSYFARNGLDPLHLYYEQVVADPQTAIDALADHLGIDQRPVLNMAGVDTSPQRDSISEEWRLRYLSEAKDLARLDALSSRDTVRKWVSGARIRFLPLAERLRR